MCGLKADCCERKEREAKRICGDIHREVSCCDGRKRLVVLLRRLSCLGSVADGTTACSETGRSVAIRVDTCCKPHVAGSVASVGEGCESVAKPDSAFCYEEEGYSVANGSAMQIIAWITVADRLPTKCGQYIIWHKDHVFMIGWCQDKSLNLPGCIPTTPPAWMICPLAR